MFTYRSHLLCDQLTYFNSNEHMSNSTNSNEHIVLISWDIMMSLLKISIIISFYSDLINGDIWSF